MSCVRHIFIFDFAQYDCILSAHQMRVCGVSGPHEIADLSEYVISGCLEGNCQLSHRITLIGLKNTSINKIVGSVSR